MVLATRTESDKGKSNGPFKLEKITGNGDLGCTPLHECCERFVVIVVNGCGKGKDGIVSHRIVCTQIVKDYNRSVARDRIKRRPMKGVRRDKEK